MAIKYKLIKETPDQLHFKESSWYLFLTSIFGLTGGVMFGIGVLAVLADGSFDMFTVLFLSIGWVFAWGAVMIYVIRFDNPTHFIFDNTKGQIQIKQRKGTGTHQVHIPYSEIDGFHVRTRTSSSSSSSGSSRTTYYVVYWQKRDSSIWDLTEFSRREKAEALVEKMTTFIVQSSKSAKGPALHLPDCLTREVKQDHVALHWRNPFSFKLFIFVMIVLGFWGITYMLYQQWQTGEGDFIPLLIFGGMLSIITAALVYGIYYNLSGHFSIQISKSKLSYCKNGQEKKAIPLEAIAAINFDFKSSVGGSPLRVLTHEQLSKLQLKPNQKFNLSDVMGLVRSAFDMFQLNIEGLDVVEKVYLEYYLQQELENFGAKRVL